MDAATVQVKARLTQLDLEFDPLSTKPVTSAAMVAIADLEPRGVNKIIVLSRMCFDLDKRLA